MRKKVIIGMKSTNTTKDFIFGTEKDFAVKGIKFNGNYACIDGINYVKAIEFPGGKWLGKNLLKMLFKEGALTLLIDTRLSEQTEDIEHELHKVNIQGNCLHALFAYALMDGNTEEEATKFVVNTVVKLKLGFTPKEIKEYLECPICSI